MMRKVAPILKPIAVLTISTIVATATGVVNSSSYRTPSSSTVEETAPTDTMSHPLSSEIMDDSSALSSAWKESTDSMTENTSSIDPSNNIKENNDEQGKQASETTNTNERSGKNNSNTTTSVSSPPSSTTSDIQKQDTGTTTGTLSTQDSTGTQMYNQQAGDSQ